MFRQKQKKKTRAVYEMKWKNRAARQATDGNIITAQDRFDLHAGQLRHYRHTLITCNTY